MPLDKIFSSLFTTLDAGITMLQPPQWMVKELQNKLIVFLNHVLQKQDLALRELLAKRTGSVVQLNWRHFELRLQITPIGLFSAVLDENVLPTLRLQLADESIETILASLEADTKPRLHIEGDVAMATDINYVIENIRWDFADDLATIFGDKMAFILTSIGKTIAKLLREVLTFLPKSYPEH